MSRLTEEMVIARAKQSDLALIKKLNCWGSDLSDVSIIKRMHGVEVLALSVNKITTLAPFEDCIKLQELYLRKNEIGDINEIRYLQNLPELRYLWLEENPCCERAGPNYRAIVLRALPSLKKLDNVDVTQEEVDDAVIAANGLGDDAYEDDYEQQQRQQQQQQQQNYQQQQAAAAAAHHQQHQQQQHQVQHTPPPTPQQQHPQSAGQYVQRRSSSPLKEETLQHSPSPMNNATNIREQQRISFHQYDRSPNSDQEISQAYRSVPIPPSISTHSMKEYYQSDRPTYHQYYRHSQSDLTGWDEHPQAQHPHAQNNQYGSQYHLNQRRSAGAERDLMLNERHGPYRNGNARENGGDWEDVERPRSRRPDGGRPYSDSVSNVSMVNHCTAHHHRRPVNRNSNLLSAALCIVKELDVGSLEVLEHAVRCRLDEMTIE